MDRYSNPGHRRDRAVRDATDPIHPRHHCGVGPVDVQGVDAYPGVVLSALNLLNVPFGTMLGIDGLWVLLSRAVEKLFDGTGHLAVAS